MLAIKTLITSIGVALLVATAPAFAANNSDVKLTFRTQNCDGTTGFASVSADRVYRIKAIACQDGDAVSQVYQVMVRTGSSYDVFTVADSEAEELMQKVEAYQDDKRQSLRESDRLILERGR